jgi:glycosyltransferase involved in cell wall biosynthesis
VTSHPAQYTAPFFRHLTGRPELDITVLYCSSLGVSDTAPSMDNFGRKVVWDIDLVSGYRWKVMGSPIPANPQNRWTMLGTGLIRELMSARYDLVVIYGWAYPANWVAFLLCRTRKIPFLLYGDTNVRDPGALLAAPLRRPVLGRLCRAAAGALYTGAFNRDFYVQHGMPSDRLWFSPYAVENERFALGSRQRARERLQLCERVCYILFAGTLIPRKRPLSLVDAVAALQSEGRSAGLVFAGSGELEGEIRDRIAKLGVADAHMLGFVNQHALPEVYAAADALVLPSAKDPRATVVNEAMAAGLPVIVSSGTGVWGAGDLVEHGRDGFVFETDDADGLLRACRAVLDPELRNRMGSAAADRIKDWSFDTAADGWVEAARAVANR